MAVLGTNEGLVDNAKCSRTRVSRYGNGNQKLSEMARKAAYLVQEAFFLVVVSFLFMMGDGRELFRLIQ